jgi:hypothetical protein
VLHARPDYNRIQDPAGLIPEDEPVFLIRGQDRNAPAVLRHYAMQAQASGAADDLVLAALKQADRMAEWQKNHKRKTPDL